jgi:outer membrane protein TolC
MPVVNRAQACLLAVGVAALTTGCAVGPDFERPAAPEVEGYAREPLPAETAKADITGGETQRFVQGLDIPGQWWTLLHSEALNTLIEQALRNNPTTAAAQAALRLSWENVYAGEGAFFPTAIAGYSPSRNKTATGVVFTSASSGKPWFSLHTSQVVVAYAPDVFGGTRRQVELELLTQDADCLGLVLDDLFGRGDLPAQRRLLHGSGCDVRGQC